MGYRNYLGKIPKSKYNKIKSLTKQELCDYYGVDNLMSVFKYGEEIYELGKYVDLNLVKGTYLPFFKKNDVKEEYYEHAFLVVNKNFLKNLIIHYSEKIKIYYSEMLEPFNTDNKFLNSAKYDYDDNFNLVFNYDFTLINSKQQNALYKILEHIKSFNMEWKCNDYLPFNLDDNKPAITTSWKYEYEIFELVRIYKSFNWKKDVMIYYGY